MEQENLGPNGSFAGVCRSPLMSKILMGLQYWFEHARSVILRT